MALSIAPISKWLTVQQHTLAFLQRHAPVSSLPPHLLTGLRGEQAALYHLRALGFTIVAQRWTAPNLRGDLDLVAWRMDATPMPTLVFFEVKTRTRRDFAPADTAVDADKQKQVRRMAHAYLRQLPSTHRDQVPIRFDLLSVYLLSTGTEFEHFPAAFSAR